MVKRIRDDSGKFVKTADEASEAPVISSEDAINEERQRINDEQVSSFLGEEVKDGKVTEEKETKETPVEKEPELKEEDIDLDTLKKQLKEEVRKETSAEITEKLTAALGEKPTEAQKDKYEEYSEKFAAEKGRNPSWFELVPFIKDEVKAEMKADQENAYKAQEANKAEIARTNEQKQKAFNQYVDEQLEDLHVSGKLVRGDEESRAALFTKMMEVNQERAKSGKPPIYSVKEIFYEHFTPPKSQPAGADAPISAGRGNAQIDSGEDYSYLDIKKKSFVDLFRR